MSVLLLLACIVPFTPLPSFSFLSLVVPLLVIFNILFLLYWISRRKYLFATSLVALLVGYFVLGSFIEFRKPIKLEEDKALKIMTFNSLGFSGYGNAKNTDDQKGIVSFVRKEEPDIICFQEFDDRRKYSGDFDQFPFQYMSTGPEGNKGRVLLAILSKYPIINGGVLDFPDTNNNAIFSDVIIKEDTVRIYNLHLESLKVRPRMLKKERSDRLFKRLRYSFSKQQEQAAIFRQNANDSKYSKIVCGDFNNTQFSNAYRIIKGDMRDSFSEKGSGYGKTINFWHFPLRIDFIMADPEMEITGHQNYDLQLSDHEPVMASIKLSSKK
ncbi:endonuclease/exonuclease/phosphatase family protein [Maribacter sp. 4U21]|uniref:endonuclease/exonuclease/phosphatase family protein n=1 Tax=Maribacter sp. 4U21 TaxID=1889779 RepID=UPI0015D4B383|nr:endonuclease/exonuclease/phosphatase family protein [Maribacter sp. 4U21]